MCRLKKYILYQDFIFGDVEQKDLLFRPNASPKGQLDKRWGCGSVVGHLYSMHGTWVLFPALGVLGDT